MSYRRGSLLQRASVSAKTTRHNGQRSRLRRGLCEAVGQLMGRELKANATRCGSTVHETDGNVGDAIGASRRPNRNQIALVEPDGQVIDI